VGERLVKVRLSEVGISVITEAELRLVLAKKFAAVRLGVAGKEFPLRVEILHWNSAAAKCEARNPRGY
jgi:tRNA(fMet)-specific endonuclease VapC